MTSTPTQLLQEFIADEASSLIREERGGFYSDNHHRITPLIARAPRLLSHDERIELYFHLLRRDECPSLKSKEEFALLRQAYARIKPLFSRTFSCCVLTRTKALLLFGEDDRSALAEEPNAPFESYLKYLKFWRYTASFSHMPGMLKKRLKFLEQSQDKALLMRVEQILLRMQLDEDRPRPTCLWFWAMVFLAIQEKTTGRSVIEKIITAPCSIEDQEDILKHLARYLAVSEQAELLALVEERQNQLSAKAAPSPLADFIARLGFIRATAPWGLRLIWSTTDPTNWITGKNKLKPTDMRLRLELSEKSWSVSLSRRDEKFFVLWPPSEIRVESAELRYRRMTPWPTIQTPDEVPMLVRQLEVILAAKFVHDVDVGGSLSDAALSKKFDDTRLRQWIGYPDTDWSVFGQKSKPGKKTINPATDIQT